MLPVIEGYRREVAEGGMRFFAIGNCHLDPLAQLIAEDNVVDAAILELTAEQAKYNYAA